MHQRGILIMKVRWIDWIALTLVVLGAINWGLIGFFRFDLLTTLFGSMTHTVSRVMFALVGLAGLYCLTFYGKMDNVHIADAR